MEGLDNLLRDLVLKGKDIPHFTVIALCPDMAAGGSVQQLGINAHPVIGPAHTPFQNVADAQVAPDLLNIDRSALVGKRGIAGNDKQAGDF